MGPWQHSPKPTPDRTNPGTMAQDKFEMIDEQAPHSNDRVQQEETDHTNSGMLTMPGEQEMQPLSPNAGGQEEEPDHTNSRMLTMPGEQEMQPLSLNGSASGQEEEPEQKCLSPCYKYIKARIGTVISHIILIVIIIVIACLLLRARENQKIQAVQMGTSVPLNCQKDVIECLPVTCPPDWIQHQGHCYKLSEEEKNWTESQHFCILHKASLAKITKEERGIMKMFTRDRFFWIGLKRESNQPWKWLDGDNATMEVEGNGGDCAFLDSDFTARSVRCSTEHYYMCKKTYS
ncbi:C-type lectin domain family 2 member D-like isoform X2 [Crotalus tigris]|uniref:C-type lectin domain family 2 member D-like isoform X2 n=1 Tax=Crotalus tigris TaxID=88082 RepID=UPI00192F8D2E|nr:C-type lectin domain family 2 member D-like isoform X2 [Crotalus tigris]